MQVGDIVLSLGNQKEADGVGIIVGDYERDDYEHYPHKRKVEWLAKDNKFPVYELNGNKNLVQQTVYKLHRFNADQIIKLLGQNLVIDDDCSNKNYILIIDEINRGNISKIFGELITLIEPSKRIGGDEEIRLTLPYSGHTFGVPKNLYIIGTMNTADRSIALMDTALRRRFEFTEMMPDLEIVGELDSIDGINIRLLLEKINQRIEYLYDRDHQIGHAYFMSLIDKSGAEAKKELDNIFRNKIIPLLQEYFYDDWEKIQMVLGDHPDQNAEDVDKFIKSNKVEEKRLFGFDHEEVEDEQIIYTINKNFTDLAYTKISEFQKTNAN
jgi:5-methylcytosine-specific restriction protein B